MEKLRRSGAIDFTTCGDPPDSYAVRFSAASLAPGDAGMPVPVHHHQVRLYCHLEYPRRPPVVTWETPILHPNIISPQRGGAVCLGPWSASEGLADVCRRLIRMARYDLVNTTDALDPDAARSLAMTTPTAASAGTNQWRQTWT
jgi:ubiquitin-protein ligase